MGITMRAPVSRALGLVLLGLALWLTTAIELAAADRAMFWSVTRDGQHKGYLLGTIHSEDPRVLEFPEAFIEQLAANEIYAMEMVPDLPTLSRLTEYMHFQDGTRLESLIGGERFGRLAEAVSSYRVPMDWVGRMKVWAAMITLSVPPPRSGLFMDFSLSLRAAGAGLKVRGLETLEQQLSFLEDMPLDMQIGLLDQALDEYANVQKIHDEMVEHYLLNDLQGLVRVTEEQLAGVDAEVRDYFMEQGIDARNRRMFETLSPLLEQHTVFTAVGALHLPGPEGLIALLRGAGYRLAALPLPLTAYSTVEAP
jgi:uncharacterized protein YbaP (TraB family)